MAEANPYMTPGSAVETAPGEFRESAVFSFAGRAGRLRYLARTMIMTMCLYLAMGVVVAAFWSSVDVEAADPAQLGGPILAGYFVFAIVSVVFGLMFAIQRLHDVDRSGWHALLIFVPIVNALFGLYLLFARGTDGENRYGPPPPPNTLGVKLGAFIFPLIVILGVVAAIAIPAYQDYAVRAQEAQLQSGQ